MPRKAKVSNGSQIQSRLYDLLLKSTPYVKVESSVMRFDLAAYIPRDIRVGFKTDPQLRCSSRFRGKHCELKWDAMREEAALSNEEHEALLLKATEGIDREANYRAYYEARDKVPQFILGDRGWAWDNHLYNATEKECRCDNNEDCPTWLEQYKKEERELAKGIYLPGLHLFEIKSDLDSYTRLVHQLPAMYGIADYAWLVLGEKQEIPTWLPPWIGVLRFIEKGKKFQVERKEHIEKGLPSLHPRWLKEHDTSTTLRPSTLRELFKKWSINAMFGWEAEAVVVDMTPELMELAKISKWCKKEIEDLGTVQKTLIDWVSLPEAAHDS